MRKVILSLLTLLLVALPVEAQTVVSDSVPARKKVALVLSGGGALGAAHAGALKVIEEAGLPVDIVVGTSIGSIVGSMYSVGYNSSDIASMFRTTDWAEMFLDTENQRHLTLRERDDLNTYFYQRDFYVRGGIDPQPGGVIRGTNIESTFAHYLQGYTDSINFLSDLPRKFACVATDLITDEAVVLTDGLLVKSIRSSMSIPGVFTPVRMGDKVLVDGGTKNNFPADVARELGADYVIGIWFDMGLDKRYRSLMDVLERSAGSDIYRRARDNDKYCDLLIRVPVKGYSSGSFTRGAIDSLIVRGERAAREKLDSILLLKSQAGALAHVDYTMHLRDINNLQPPEDDHTGLIDSRQENTLSASVAVRYDLEDIAALQLKGLYFDGGRLNTELALTIRLGLRSMLRLALDIEPSPFKRMGLSYELWHNLHQGIYSEGERLNYISYLYQRVNAKLFSFDAMNFDCELGLGWEHYHLFKGKWNAGDMIDFDGNGHYFNYHVRLRYNNEDNYYFARRGVRAEARYDYFTDNFAQWKGHVGFSALMAACQVTIPIARNTHLRPSVQGRLLFGDDLPTTVQNMAGGMTRGKFFPQQMPLAGFGHVEVFDSKFVGASLRLQQRVKGQHYVLLDGSVAEHNDKVADLFERKPIWGVQAAYYYNSRVLGPLGASLGWSSHTKKVHFFLSLGYDF